jgi:hypothetical protein
MMLMTDIDSGSEGDLGAQFANLVRGTLSYTRTSKRPRRVCKYII